MSTLEKITTPKLTADVALEASIDSLSLPELSAARTLGRNAVLRALLDEPYATDASPEHPGNDIPGNYETAVKTGLLDAFYYDLETGQDAILHILAGDTWEDPKTGARQVGGYHHEPSALLPTTSVDTERMARKGGGSGRLAHHPFGTYKNYVVVDGFRKKQLNTMFPSEYDAFAVLQTIKLARDNRDTSQDKEANNPKYVYNDVEMPLLDGRTTVNVRLVMDGESRQIITAMPLGAGRGLEGQTPEDIQRHLGLEDPRT
ncbi:MAG TPA: EndoU domain-containing protein [Candidatus Limnocylindria bacterium]|nr:EndoU domain-containing protein [Candidatus Limnocylindria bacterium]